MCSLVGGVDDSDIPDDPAVDGLSSRSRESFRAPLFLRVGTPSGQEHCNLTIYEKLMFED